MDLYNIKVDVVNFLKKNSKVLIFYNIFVAIAVFVGCVVAFSCDCRTFFENSGNAYFVYLTDGSKVTIAVNVFVSAVIYLVLLVLSKSFHIARKFGFILVCYRVYEVFYRMTVIMLYFGLKSVFPALMVCLCELLFCALLEIIFLLNNSEKRGLCKSWITEEYLMCIGVIAVVALVINVILCILFSVLKFFT